MGRDLSGLLSTCLNSNYISLVGCARASVASTAHGTRRLTYASPATSALEIYEPQSPTIAVPFPQTTPRPYLDSDFYLQSLVKPLVHSHITMATAREHNDATVSLLCLYDRSIPNHR